jgi:hypothetical protein
MKLNKGARKTNELLNDVTCLIKKWLIKNPSKSYLLRILAGEKTMPFPGAINFIRCVKKGFIWLQLF